MKILKPLKTVHLLSAAGLFVACTLGSAAAQATPPDSIPAAQPAQNAVQSSDKAAPDTQNPENSGTYATGRPLDTTSHEGFWGHVNPFARKKWVHRQIDPIKDRTNELDQLQAKNANDIRDVDSRATAGINQAMNSAQTADAHAADAANRANAANSLALAANGKTTALNGTISGLDQYQPVTSTSVRFIAGHTALTARQKAELDGVATSLASQKGYIVEVQGYSRAGVATSQAMADAVVRYLVTAHQVPVYRIYRTGLGKASPAISTQTAPNASEKPLTNGVRVTILQNSLASMDAPATGSGVTPASLN